MALRVNSNLASNNIIRQLNATTRAVGSDSDRSSLQAEFGQLVSEIDRIAQSTTFNNQVLLTGFGNSVDPTSTALAQSNTTGITKVDPTSTALRRLW